MNRKGRWVLAVILGAAIFVVAGKYMLQRAEVSKTIIENGSSLTEENRAATTPTPETQQPQVILQLLSERIDTQNWKTYTHDIFEVSYPQSYQLSSPDPKVKNQGWRLSWAGERAKVDSARNVDDYIYIYFTAVESNSELAAVIIDSRNRAANTEKIQIGEKILERWYENGMTSSESLVWVDSQTNKIASFHIEPLENPKLILEAYSIIASFKFSK